MRFRVFHMSVQQLVAYYSYRASLTRLALYDFADFAESERLRRAWEALRDAAR